MSESIRILIADDHPIVRRGLVDLLIPRNGMEVIGEAYNGQEAVDLAQQLQPDVIVMDLVMPELNGAAATKRIIKRNPDARILILTSFSEEDMLQGTLNAGVLGYMLKDSPAEELLQAIRSVYQGQLTVPPQLARKLMTKSVESPKNNYMLTKREQDVLQAVSEGLSNKQIAKKLEIGSNTVRTHISNILRKLNLSNRTQLAIYAKDQGNKGQRE